MSLVYEIPNILSLLEKNPILKIVSPMGSGKTQILPKELSKEYSVTMVTSQKQENSITPKEYWETKIGNLLILDEIDQGSLEQFLIITDWVQNKSKKVKLVLLSSFSHSYFPGFPVLRVPSVNKIQKEIRYTQDFSSYDSILSSLIQKVYELHLSSISGDFLIFTADKTSASHLIKKLRSILENAEVLGEGETPSNQNLRKILITTDLGKTSTSLHKFSCIFDTMMERKREKSLVGGVRKKLIYISQRDAQIRASRSLISTIVYRFISKEKFDSLPETPKDVTDIYPPHLLILKLYEKGLNPLQIIPKAKEVSTILLNFGFLTISKKLTPKGKSLLKIPLGLKPALLSFEGNTYSSLISSSLIDSFEKSPFLFPKKRFEKTFEYEIEMEKHISTYFNKFRGLSDLETLLNIYCDFKFSRKNLKKWCFDNFIDYNYMTDVEQTIKKSNKIYQFLEEEEPILDTLKNMEKTIAEIYPELELDESIENYGVYIHKNGEKYKIDSLSVNTIEEERPKSLYPIIGSKLDDEKNLISVSYVSPDVSLGKKEESYIRF